MTLECVMLVLDNSVYSINGDYVPNRLSAQADAVHILFNHKLNMNPENEVGLMVMAGKAPEVLVTPTQDEGKLIQALHTTKQGGLADLSTAINVAQLALKHRQNKNQRQRIIVFVGSPLAHEGNMSTAALVKLGKKMKKNNVAIDIVAFGSPDDAAPPTFSLPSTSTSIPTESGEGGSSSDESNEARLRALHEAVNASDNSHFLAVEPGKHLLSDRIAQSGIMRREGDDDGPGGGGGGSGGANDEFGGIDPNMDPELAMALRMSLEEERARQAAAAAPKPSSDLPTVAETSSASATTESAKEVDKESKKEADESVPLLSDSSANVEDVGMQDDEDDEDEDLARALALSKGGEDVDMAADGDEDDEDAEIARAIALSMKEEEDEQK